MGLFSKFFKKDAEIIDTPEKLANVLGAWYDTSSGIEITPGNALQIATVYQCIKVLAESVGMLPISLMREVNDTKVKATDHALFEILYTAPNDYMTAQEFKELIVAHLCLRGNHYSYINRVGGRIAELLPLAPGAVTPKLLGGAEVEYKVNFANGTVQTLGPNEIFHVKLMTIDGVTGLSPIAQGRHTIGLAKATEIHGSALFKNGAQPSGGFKTEKTLSDDQYNRLKSSLTEKEGTENSFKPLILEGGLDWVSVAVTPQDAQYLETRKFQRSDICGLFRVPPHKIGDLEKATFSNIEHQGLEFVTDSLMPLLTRIENRVRLQLLTKDERKTLFAKFNANALLRGDMKARADFYTKMLQNGAMSPNEIRAKEDMNPREGGDIFLTPLNMAINGKPQEEDNENEK
ncbi:phage portal protein [Psychrosphaera sp. 1_MG-2023]|uniref:phage portal protein n=1 Tax=Psychrosphaera sp. 1_MG-2023 TaxID=3062643 RepID=UPI0026E46C70|nr:phage portal protein [Psychrosphaera sp. 1_MG-2023]MDO6718822.1 phage portal protein [Psychrosphaera sp. 1_MG-2023]